MRYSFHHAMAILDTQSDRWAVRYGRRINWPQKYGKFKSVAEKHYIDRLRSNKTLINNHSSFGYF